MDRLVWVLCNVSATSDISLSLFVVVAIEWYDVGCLPVYDEYLVCDQTIVGVGSFQLLCWLFDIKRGACVCDGLFGVCWLECLCWVSKVVCLARLWLGCSLQFSFQTLWRLMRFGEVSIVSLIIQSWRTDRYQHLGRRKEILFSVLYNLFGRFSENTSCSI